MAGGTYNPGSAAQIKIGTSDPPSILLEGVVSGKLAQSRSVTTTAIYNQEPDDVERGKATRTWNITGRCRSGAPGLILAQATYDDDADTVLYLSGSLEGTKGKSIPVLITNMDVDFPDANKRCTYTIQATEFGAATALAGGNIFD